MEYLYLGKIVSTHGIKGEIRLLLNDFFIYDILDNKFLPNHEIVNLLFIRNKQIYIGKDKELLTINSYRHHKIYEMLCFDGYDNINDILKYKGLKCYIKNNILTENQIVLLELIGYKIYFNNSNYGNVIDYQNNNGNIILEIDGEKKFFIPMNANFIESIDKINKIIYTKNIEGLII